MIRARDAGFAMVMAVVAAGLFAYMALLFLQTERGDISMSQARMQRTRLANAADAGVMLALHGLGLEDRARRWSIDGTPRRLTFDGIELTIVVEDERGKVPLNRAAPDVLRRLLAGAGVPETAKNSLSDALLDWIDSDDAMRPEGAEAKQYRALGSDIIPRNGKVRSVDELLHVRGMTPELLAHIAPAISIHFGEYGAFSEKTASPLALMAMQAASENSVQVQTRARDTVAGNRPALEIADDVSLRGRPLTIRVDARIPDIAAFTRTAVVEFTRSPAQPFWVREFR